MKAKVTLEMTTTGYTALEAYLKWLSGKIDGVAFQGTLTSLGYELDVANVQDMKGLAVNLLGEIG